MAHAENSSLRMNTFESNTENKPLGLKGGNTMNTWTIYYSVVLKIYMFRYMYDKLYYNDRVQGSSEYIYTI